MPTSAKAEQILEEARLLKQEANAVISGNGISGVRAFLNQKERHQITQLKAYLKQQDQEISGLREQLESLGHLQSLTEPKPSRLPRKKGKRRLSAIFASSDTHWQEKITLEQTGGINEHDPSIGHERIRNVHDQLIDSIKRKSRTAEVFHLTYWQGGDDMVNADMHDGLLSNFVDAMPLEEMEATYKMRHAEHSHLSKRLDVPVRVVVSVSNHDRDTPQMQAGLAARRSYDMAIAQRLARDFDSWEWHLEPTYYAMSQVGEFRTAFHHGHSKRASVRVTASGLRAPPWSFLVERQLISPFQLWIQGHRHSDSFVRSSRMAFSENGCTCGPNGYSTDSGFAPEPPSQHLIYVDHETGTIESRETLYA